MKREKKSVCYFLLLVNADVLSDDGNPNLVMLTLEQDNAFSQAEISSAVS